MERRRSVAGEGSVECADVGSRWMSQYTRLPETADRGGIRILGPSDSSRRCALCQAPFLGGLIDDYPVEYCDKCHGLAWIERSGGSLDGWTSRLYRMNRAGAMVPVEQIPVIAAYLAEALPERPRPPAPPKQRSGPSFSSSLGESP